MPLVVPSRPPFWSCPGTSDKGIILLRSMLQEQLEKLERGEDPMAVVRDPAKNVCIRVPREEDAFFTHTGGMLPDDVEDRLSMIRKRRDTDASGH